MPIRMAQYGFWLLPTNCLCVFDHLVALVLKGIGFICSILHEVFKALGYQSKLSLIIVAPWLAQAFILTQKKSEYQYPQKLVVKRNLHHCSDSVKLTH